MGGVHGPFRRWPAGQPWRGGSMRGVHGPSRRWPAGQPWPQPAARKPCVEEADSLLVEPPVGFVLRQEDFHRLARGLGVRVCWVRAPRPRMLERGLRQRQLHRGEVGVWLGEVGARPVLRGSRNTALTCDTTRLPNMAGSTWARRRNESSMRSTMPIQRYLRGGGGREEEGLRCQSRGTARASYGPPA